MQYTVDNALIVWIVTCILALLNASSLFGANETFFVCFLT